MKRTIWKVGLGASLALSLGEAWAQTACKANYLVSEEWNSGFVAAVSVDNLGDPLTSWTLGWNMPDGQLITEIWDAAAPKKGPQVQVVNAAWNGSVAKGGKLQFGFVGSHTGKNGKPRDITMNGVLCEGQATEPPPPPPVACSVEYVVRSEWDSGFTADVVVRNQGGPLSGWTVSWDMPNQQSVTSLWNGRFIQSGDHVAVQNLDWNRDIASGGRIEFGFNGAHNGLNNKPGNIALNGVKCAGQVDPPPPPAPSCKVNYAVSNQWNTGYTAEVAIQNTGAPLNGWAVTWTMPAGQQVTSLWNGALTQQGSAVKVGNLDYNRLVRTNESFGFGFNASHSGENPPPTDFAVNGARCEGQPDPGATPPAAPSNLIARMVDNSYARLTWADNSATESSMVLERRALGNLGVSVLTPLPADAVVFEDHDMEIGVLYEYRVKAVNASGSSGFSNVVSARRQDRNQISAAMLANNCAICHGGNGVSAGPGIPSISGLSRDYFLHTMRDYQRGARASSVMQRIAKGYSDQQLQQMADHYSALPFTRAQQSTDQALVDRGRGIHQVRCQACHTGVGEEQAGSGTRLDGQWAVYLNATLEDYAAGRSSNLPPAMGAQLAGITAAYGEDALRALAEYYAADPQLKDGAGGDPGDPGDGGDPNQPPAAPTLLGTTVIDNAGVKLTWNDAANNELGFRVERRTATSGSWGTLAQLGANALTYTDSAVTLGTDYEYRVSAYNNAGTGVGPTAYVEILTLLEYGTVQYQNQGCAACHGNDGKGGVSGKPLTGFTSAQRPQLATTITTTMPPANKGACAVNCGLATAEYLIQTFGGGSGGGDPPPPSCSGAAPAGARSLRLLSRNEYQNTVNDLLGLDVNVVQLLAAENRVNGYDNNVANNLVTAERMEGFLGAAEGLADQAVQSRFSLLIPAGCTAQSSACFRQFIESFGKRAFRRPLTTVEVDHFAGNYSGRPYADAVKLTVTEMLMSPNFLYRSEVGELQSDGTYLLTPYEVASALSYLFAGSTPDAALMQAADAGQLATPAQRTAHATRLLNSAAGRRQVGHFVGQWLLASSPYVLPEKDTAVYPGYTEEVRKAMSKELMDFFNHVAFDSSGRFWELFSANYAIITAPLAGYYGLTLEGQGPAKVFDVNGSRGGLLTLGAVHARYANASQSHPFKRGKFVYERLLCHDMPAPQNNGIVMPPVADPNMTGRERWEFHSSTPACATCHKFIDPPGFGFENYDGAGGFRTMEGSKPIDAAGALLGLNTFSVGNDQDPPLPFIGIKPLGNQSAPTLSDIAGNSSRAAQCLATQYYRYATGRKEGTADQCALDSFLQGYAPDKEYRLPEMLLGIINAPGFVQRRAQ